MAIINPMNNDSPTNPYQLDGDVSVAPFAGRQDAFGRLYGLTSDPGRQHAFLFLGRQGVGKTALLHALSALHNETAICPIIPLRDMEITHEAAWLLDLAQSVTAVLIERGFTLSRLSMIEAPGADMRLWLDTVFLPHIFATIRPTRQLIFLFDDADRLLLEIKTGTLPADLLDFFVELLKKYRQLQFVFTLDTEFEDQISEFGALVLRCAPLREIRRGGDADQARQPITQRQARQQHQPAAHRRADQHHPAQASGSDQRQNLVAPARQRAIGEIARAFSASRIIEEQARPPVRLRPVEHGSRLAAGHVGHVTGQEDDCRRSAGR